METAKWLGFWLVFVGLSLQALAVEIRRPTETGVIRLRGGLGCAEARELAEPLLSADGKVAALEERNLLVIYDYPENIAAVRDLLKQLDTAPANVRITVSFRDSRTREGAAADIRVPGVRIIRRDGETRTSGRVDVSIGAGESSTLSSTTQFVMAGNNRPARIWVGADVPDAVWVFETGVRHGWWRREIVWREIGASLWVRPRILDDAGRVEVEVYPRITVRGEEALSVDVQELGTRVVAANGETVTLGGLSQSKREAYRRLFGIGEVFDGRDLAVTLTPEIVTVGPQRP